MSLRIKEQVDLTEGGGVQLLGRQSSGTMFRQRTFKSNPERGTDSGSASNVREGRGVGRKVVQVERIVTREGFVEETPSLSTSVRILLVTTGGGRIPYHGYTVTE